MPRETRPIDRPHVLLLDLLLSWGTLVPFEEKMIDSQHCPTARWLRGRGRPQFGITVYPESAHHVLERYARQLDQWGFLESIWHWGPADIDELHPAHVHPDCRVNFKHYDQIFPSPLFKHYLREWWVLRDPGEIFTVEKMRARQRQYWAKQIRLRRRNPKYLSPVLSTEGQEKFTTPARVAWLEGLVRGEPADWLIEHHPLEGEPIKEEPFPLRIPWSPAPGPLQVIEGGKS